MPYKTSEQMKQEESVFMCGAVISGIYITKSVLKDFNNGTTRNTLKSIMVTAAAVCGAAGGSSEGLPGAIVGGVGGALLGSIVFGYFLDAIGYNVDSYTYCKHCKNYFDHRRYVEKRAICDACRKSIKAYGYRFE